MAQPQNRLSDTRYMGTLSELDTTKPTAREARGKNKCNKRNPRISRPAYTDTLVTRADGTQYVIPRKTSRAGVTRTTKKAVNKQQVIKEILSYGASQRSKLSMDEIRRINGL